MSQARTPTPTKRGAPASTTQVLTASRGSKALRSADDGGRDKDDDDVRRDMTAEFDDETKAGDAEGAVAETDAERASPAPAPPRQSAPLAASRAYPPFFREAGRVGRADSSTIRIAHVQLMTRGEPNANPSPALYMSGYGLADLFESFASTASKDAVDKRKSLRTIWNGMSRTDRILFTLTNCACVRYVPVLLPPGSIYSITLGNTGYKYQVAVPSAAQCDLHCTWYRYRDSRGKIPLVWKIPDATWG